MCCFLRDTCWLLMPLYFIIPESNVGNSVPSPRGIMSQDTSNFLLEWEATCTWEEVLWLSTANAIQLYQSDLCPMPDKPDETIDVGRKDCRWVLWTNYITLLFLLIILIFLRLKYKTTIVTAILNGKKNQAASRLHNTNLDSSCGDPSHVSSIFVCQLLKLKIIYW